MVRQYGISTGWVAERLKAPPLREMRKARLSPGRRPETQNPATFRPPGFTIRFCCHALMSAEALSGDCRLHAHGRVIIRTYELHCLARSSIARRTYFSPSRSASKPVAPSYSRGRFARTGPRCASGGAAGYRPRVRTNSFRGHRLRSASNVPESILGHKYAFCDLRRTRLAHRSQRPTMFEISRENARPGMRSSIRFPMARGPRRMALASSMPRATA